MKYKCYSVCQLSIFSVSFVVISTLHVRWNCDHFCCKQTAINKKYIGYAPFSQNTLVFTFLMLISQTSIFTVFKRGTIKFLWITRIVILPVTSIADVIQVPAGSKQSFISHAGNFSHFLFPGILPYLNYCVWSDLINTPNLLMLMTIFDSKMNSKT